MDISRPYRIEACVVSTAQAIDAFKNGADRVEVCSRLETEGMTPDVDMIKDILSQISIPVRIMIRETESGYEADEKVLNKMIAAIDDFKALNIDGFVFGLLRDGKLDRDSLQILFARCDPYFITIHKALDASSDVYADIEWLNSFSQVDTILTSGNKKTAMDGADEIMKMKNAFKRNIMAAGKITPSLLPQLHARLDLEWYHGRAIL